MSLSRKGWLSGVAVLLAFWALQGGRVWGQQHRAASGTAVSCKASVAVIGASSKPLPFPKSLAAWKRQLVRPPFSSFKGFELLKSYATALRVGNKPSLVQLAGAYSMSLKLLGSSVSAKGKPQYRFQLKLMVRKGKAHKVISNGTMRLDRGGTFFVAGPKVGARTLVLAITLK